jgi:hypothetical protein
LDIANILFRRAVSSCPTPDIAEHPAVKAAPERLDDGVPLAQECPSISFQDVLLFQFVQFAV